MPFRSKQVGGKPGLKAPAIHHIVVSLPLGLWVANASKVCLELQLVLELSDLGLLGLCGDRVHPFGPDEIKSPRHRPCMAKLLLEVIKQPSVGLVGFRVLFDLAVHLVPHRAPGFRIYAIACPTLHTPVSVDEHLLRNLRDFGNSIDLGIVVLCTRNRWLLVIVLGKWNLQVLNSPQNGLTEQ